MTFIHYEHPQAPDPVNAADLATKNYVDLGNSTHFARAYRVAAFNMPATVSQVVNPFIFDTRWPGQGASADYNPATGYYTCPVDGVYIARVTLSIGFTANGTVNSQIFWNGGIIAIVNNQNNAGTSALIAECVTIISAAAGDTINAAGAAGQASVPVRTTASETHFTVARLGSL